MEKRESGFGEILKVFEIKWVVKKYIIINQIKSENTLLQIKPSFN